MRKILDTVRGPVQQAREPRAQNFLDLRTRRQQHQYARGIGALEAQDEAARTGVLIAWSRKGRNRAATTTQRRNASQGPAIGLGGQANIRSCSVLASGA